MDKRKKIMLESVRKLISAGASDDEILESLAEVGTTKEDAEGIIAEAKSQSSSIQEAQKTEPTKPISQPPQQKKIIDIVVPKQDKELESLLGEKRLSEGEKAGSFWESDAKDFWKVKEKKKGIAIPFLGGKKNQPEAPPATQNIPGKRPLLKSVFGFMEKKPKVREIIVRSPLEDKTVGKQQSKPVPEIKGPGSNDFSEMLAPSLIKKNDLTPDADAGPQQTKKTEEADQPYAKGDESPSELEKVLSEKPPAGKTKDISKNKVPAEILKDIESAIPGTKFKSEKYKHNLIIIPNKEYLKSIIILSKALSLQYKKVCYVSLNELHESLIKNLKDASINTNNFFFVDAITRTSQSKIQKVPNAIFVSSPDSLVELSLAISDALTKQNPDVVLFDSISTMLIYEKGATATKFLHSLIGKIKASRSAAMFTALEGDANTDAVKDLGMFVDEVLTMSEYQLFKMRVGVGEMPMLPFAERQDAGLLTALKDFEMVNVRPREIVEERKSFEKDIIAEEMRQLQEKMVSLKNARQPELTKLVRKIEQLEKKSAAEKAIPDILKELREMKGELSKVEKKPFADSNALVKRALEEITGKLNRLSVPKGDRSMGQLKADFQNLSEKLNELEKHPMQLKEQKLMEQQLKNLSGKMSKIQRGSGIKKYVKSIVAEIKKQKPKPIPKAGLKNLENKLVNIEKKMRAESKRRTADAKRQKALETRKAKLEGRNQRAASQVASLEKKFRLLNESYSLGMVSKSAYEKDKAKIESLLRKGH